MKVSYIHDLDRLRGLRSQFPKMNLHYRKEELYAFKFTGQSISTPVMRTLIDKSPFARPTCLKIEGAGLKTLYAELGDMVYYDGTRWWACSEAEFYSRYVAA